MLTNSVSNIFSSNLRRGDFVEGHISISDSLSLSESNSIIKCTIEC